MLTQTRNGIILLEHFIGFRWRHKAVLWLFSLRNISQWATNYKHTTLFCEKMFIFIYVPSVIYELHSLSQLCTLVLFSYLYISH